MRTHFRAALVVALSLGGIAWASSSDSGQPHPIYGEAWAGPVQNPVNGLECATVKPKAVVELVSIQCSNQTEHPITFRMQVARQNLDSEGRPDETIHVIEGGKTEVLRTFNIPRGKRWSLKYKGKQTLGRLMTEAPMTQQILPFVVGQKFQVTQIFGGILTSHKGEQTQYSVDFGVPLGTPVVATHDGVVALTKTGSRLTGSTETYRGLENLVLIYSASTNTWTTYAHLGPELNVKLGDRVQKGDLIGVTGPSGMMGGPHLHYAVEMSAVESAKAIPFSFVDRNGVPLTLTYAQRYVAR